MSAKIVTLIDKYDNMELIRNEVAAILLLEKNNQKVLAEADGQDPELWNFDVYVERSSPWELVENSEGSVIRQTPLINVYLDNAIIDTSMSDDISRQSYNTTINIDCLSAKVNRIDEGQIKKSDELASLDAQRIVRLVRNILMAAVYRRLGLPEIIHSRNVQSITMFQPQINDRPAQHCIGARLVLSVLHNEFSPEYETENLEFISGQMTRGEDGALYNNLDYDVEET